MAQYLIAISIGPVQDFIASARKTRDLWFGSWLLSEISKAVALKIWKVNEDDSALIFPAPESPKIDLSENSPFNVGNKLLAEVSSQNPKELAGDLKAAASERWKDLAEAAIAQIKSHHTEFNYNEELWNAQVDDVIEFYSAWTSLENTTYSAARERVDALLAARKNTREFIASSCPSLGAEKPKSSLDGLRETVLTNELKPWQKRKMGLNEGEQLDCPGVVKRLGGKNPDQFTPISRIAIDPILRSIASEKDTGMSEIIDILKKLVDAGWSSNVRGNDGVYDSLPFDGQLLYPFRLEAAKNEVKRATFKDHDERVRTQLLLTGLEEAIEKASIRKQLRKATPYMAVLLADGDNMGRMLGELQDKNSHQAVSKRLAAFASEVPAIVRKNNGHCIYAGGDDVLALLPLDTAVKCARALHDKFAERLADVSRNHSPTLSVGLAVGHFLEPMGRLLDIARRAEKLAKGNELAADLRKNGFAILLKPRSGAEVAVRSRWPDNPDRYMHDWVNAHVNDWIPDGAAYELKSLAHCFEGLEEENSVDAILKAETLRILKRKKASRGEKKIDERTLQHLCDRAATVGPLQLANELIISRRLAESVICTNVKNMEASDA